MNKTIIVADNRNHGPIRDAGYSEWYSFFKTCDQKFPDTCGCVDIFIDKYTVTGSDEYFLSVERIKFNTARPMDSLSADPRNAIGIHAESS